jgi:hypothetical protein
VAIDCSKCCFSGLLTDLYFYHTHDDDGKPDLGNDQELASQETKQTDVVPFDRTAGRQEESFDIEDDSRIVSAVQASI